MAKANPFDPKNSSVSQVMYVTPTSTNAGFQFAYPLSGQTTLTELSPKGVIAQAGTLSTNAPW